MGSKIKGARRENVVVMLGEDQSENSPGRWMLRHYGSSAQVACIAEAIDRLSDFTTDSWPEVLLVQGGGSGNMLRVMAEICRSAGVRLVSESEHMCETSASWHMIPSEAPSPNACV
jgi:hypothetical protein